MNTKTKDPNYFLGVDIGSSECKLALARLESGDHQNLEIVLVDSFSTEGSVERSSIVNIEKLSEQLFEHLNALLENYSEQQIYTTFSIKDRSIRSKINQAKNPFSHRMREVRRKDLNVARDMASNAPLESGRDYIHIMTRHYRVDDRLPRKNPEGDLGSSVEAEIFLVSAMQEEILKLKRCSEKAKHPFDYLCSSPVAAGEVVLTQEEKEDGVLLIDIGAQSTSAAIFEKGSPKNLVSIPFGSDDVTRDICKELFLPYEIGEQVKLKFACVDPMYLSEFQNVESLNSEEGKVKEIYPEQLYKISLARFFEIIQYLYRSLHVSEELAAYPVVVTGGGARIRGIVPMIEKLTKSHVRMTQPSNWGGPIQTYRSPNFSVVVGLCAAGAKYYQTKKMRDSSSRPISYNYQNKNPKKDTWIHKLGSRLRSFFSFGDFD